MSLPWADIPVFLAIARGGTLSAAAGELKLDRTTVSRRIANMERSTNRPLFERKDGNYALSVFGRQVFVGAETAEQTLKMLSGSVDGLPHASGRLRVSMSEHLLITLAGCFRDFAVQNPDILLELTATDRLVDLQHFEADVVLRISRTSMSSFESRKIGVPIFSLYRKAGDLSAQRHYLSRPSEKSVPNSLQSLLPDASVIVAIDGLVSMREMIAVGTGAGVLPNYFGEQDRRIELCSPPLPGIGFLLYIAYLSEQRRLPRLKKFVDFVEANLGTLDGFDND